MSIVGTPIGNLGDLSPRAIETLKRADVVICEDSRRTGKLLAHFGARRSGRPELLVANDHTEADKVEAVLTRLSQGQRLALVTDAGMPTISDPGRLLVAAAAEADFDIEVVPGPTAVSSALALSALVADRYVFEGFLPRKGRVRTERLSAIAGEDRAVVFFESPKRIAATLGDLERVCGTGRRVAVARELTKLHETVIRSTVGQIRSELDVSNERGEFVVVVEGRPAGTVEIDDDHLKGQLLEALGAGRSKRDAVADVVARTGTSKRRVYELAIGL